MNDNYFKTPKGFVFFNSLDLISVGKAYERAMKQADRNSRQVSVYKLPYLAGAWDNLQIIGHRHKSEIEADLGGAQLEGDEIMVAVLSAEKAHLETVYQNANRFGSPLTVVAA